MGLLAVLLFAPGSPLNAQTSQPASSASLPSPFDPLNAQLPKWMRFSGEFRDRAEARTASGFKAAADYYYDLTRVRLDLTLTPRKWLDFYVQAQDGHPFGVVSTAASTRGTLVDVFDLRQAYVDFNAGPGNRFRLRVGRQEINLGSKRLVGSPDWNNTNRTFDAAMLTLAWPRASVDVFASAPVKINPGSFDEAQPGVNLYGIYASFPKAPFHSTFQPYLFWKTLPSVKPASGPAGDEDLYALGFRWLGSLPVHLDYEGELVREAGNYSVDTIDSWAGYGIAGYTFAKIPLRPHFSIEYDYASGNPRPGGETYSSFDQLYPSNHNTYGVADLIGWENIRILHTGVNLQPARNVTLNFAYYSYDLASRYDGLYSTSGALVVKAPAGGARSTAVGQEADILAAYHLRKNLELGGGYGHLFPGQFLKENSPGSGSSYPYAFTTYSF